MRVISLCKLFRFATAAIVSFTLCCDQGIAKSPATPSATKPANAPTDPFESVKKEKDPFEAVKSDAPVDASAYVPQKARWEAHQTNFDVPVNLNPPAEDSLPTPKGAATPTAAVPKDPCAAAVFKPLCQLGISIAQPSGEAPTDYATGCWNQINAGPNGACRCWPALCYQWEATCLAYNPLYFEEVNAERYGYVCGCRYCCGDCFLQPACSAAHFFGTVPALPYCMLADCPTECVYTLGYYRPGDCNPWRWNYPPCDGYAALGTAAIYTGFVFAIP